MTQSGKQSISQILEGCLTLNQDEASDNPVGSSLSVANSSAISASRLLLEEKKKRQQHEASKLEDFVSFSKPVQEVDPLLEQIAASTVTSSASWKGFSLATLQAAASAKKAETKTSKTVPSSINKHNEAGHRKKQQKRERGEAYKDKFTEKNNSKANRKERLAQFAKLY